MNKLERERESSCKQTIVITIFLMILVFAAQAMPMLVMFIKILEESLTIIKN